MQLPLPAPGPTQTELDPTTIQLLREEGILADLLVVFGRSAVQRLDAMRAALVGGDLAALGDQAHAMVGSAGNIGASRLASVARELEQAAHATDSVACTAAIEAFAIELDRARLALEVASVAGEGAPPRP